jgi:hypothetical protein
LIKPIISAKDSLCLWKDENIMRSVATYVASPATSLNSLEWDDHTVGFGTFLHTDIYMQTYLINFGTSRFRLFGLVLVNVRRLGP